MSASRLTRRQRNILKAYVLFAIVSFGLSIAMFVSPQFGELTVPYLGWGIFGIAYIGTLIFAIPLLVAANSVQVSGCFQAIRGQLMILMGYGLFTTLAGLVRDNFDNPYLTVTVWQPAWTIGVPLAWYFAMRQSVDLEDLDH